MSARLPSDGYVALMSVLVIGSACLAMAISLLTIGTDSNRAMLVRQQSLQARSLAAACGEEALQRVHDLTSFAGTGTLSLGQGACSYTVANSNGTITIDASASVQTVVRKIKIYATITGQNISVTSWQDVG